VVQWRDVPEPRLAGDGDALVHPIAARKGAGSRTEGLLMAYKLLDMAQARWRRFDGAYLVPLVRAGIVFVDGVQHERKPSKRARAA
jgi:hypothetical protein